MSNWEKYIEANRVSFRKNTAGLIELFADKMGPMIHVGDAIKACEMAAKQIKVESTPVEKALFNECRAFFASAYQTATGIRYAFAAKEAGALKQLIRKIEMANKEAGKPDDTAETKATFEALINNLPEWYRTHQFSLPVINSKFNEITAEIRKKNGKKDNNGISDDFRASVLGGLQA